VKPQKANTFVFILHYLGGKLLDLGLLCFLLGRSGWHLENVLEDIPSYCFLQEKGAGQIELGSNKRP
jgi:hypothetical protein